MLGRRAAAIAAFVEQRRWWIVAGCIVAQIVWISVLARTTIEHNGWLYQHGDDGPWYWTSAWALSTFHLPFAAVGYGWSYLLIPFAAIFGPNMASGLPAVIALNVLVIGPLCVVLVYLVGERLGGRLFGVWVSVLWVVLPLVGLALYRPTSRQVLLDSFFPTALGLNALSDFLSMAVALGCVYVLLRTLDDRTGAAAALLGAVLGFLLLVKPANAPLVLVAGAAVLLARRFREAAVAAVGFLPGLVALIIWKKRGKGVALEGPVTSGPPNAASEHVRTSVSTVAGPNLGVSHGVETTSTPVSGASPSGSGGSDLLERLRDLVDRIVHLPSHYIVFDRSHASANLNAFREVFWSVRLLEFLVVAGSFAIVARFRWRGVLVIAWLAAYFLVKGLSVRAEVYTTSIYRFLLPAWPAWVVIVASLVFLWPRATAGASRTRRHVGSSRPIRRWHAGVAIVALACAPGLLALVAPKTSAGAIAQMEDVGAPIPILDFHLRANRPTAASVVLRWRPRPTSAADFVYRILRSDGDGCASFTAGAPTCRLVMTQIGYTHATTFVDRHAQPLSHYRVAVAAGSHFDDQSGSDLLVLSKPVRSAR